MKNIIIILSIIGISILTLYLGFNIYSTKLENRLKVNEKSLLPLYNKLIFLSNDRIKTIKSITIKSKCLNNSTISLDSILLDRKTKNIENTFEHFNKEEIQVNKAIYALYNCKSLNSKKIDSLMNPYNDSLSKYSMMYNNKAEEFNSLIFRFPNSLFINNNKFRSKNLIRIDYLNHLESEIKRQDEIEQWIKTGKLPNEKEDIIQE